MQALTLQQAFNLAISHHRAGKLKEAEDLYRQILSHDPKHANALHFLGMLAHQSGNSKDAVELIHRAISQGLTGPDVYGNLGNALRGVGRVDESIAAFRQSLTLAPNLLATWVNLGNALLATGAVDEAISSLREAIEIDPAVPEAWNSLAVALTAKKEFNQAIAACKEAIERRPTYIDAHINLANALKWSGEIDRSITAYRDAIALNPNVAEVHSNLGGALKEAGQAEESMQSFRRAAEINGADPKLGSNLILLMHYHPGCDAAAIAKQERAWNQKYAMPLAKLIRPHNTDLTPDRRLRIGYISPDFRGHSVGRNILPLFRNHDHPQFDVTAYSLYPPDVITQEFQKYCDTWRACSELSDQQIADQVRDDRIDILVDLALHTAGHRLLVLAQKPAPVQATFAGYPGSTGLTAIDYRLSDPYLDPPGMDESIYSEKTIRLPASFWCYDPHDCSDIITNALPALENHFITFGCLNNFSKVNNVVLDLWSQVLTQVANACLLMLAPPGRPRDHVIDHLAHSGISSDRINFVANLTRRDYLQTYRRIDIALDTFPYNGHTTSLDSFWMGVPVVTLVGSTPVARAGWSQLSNLGLTELAAHTPAQFADIAKSLAGDLPRLSQLRTTLRQRMEKSPLMDAPLWTRSIEDAYRSMWIDHTKRRL